MTEVRFHQRSTIFFWPRCLSIPLGREKIEREDRKVREKCQSWNKEDGENTETERKTSNVVLKVVLNN